MAAGSDGPIPLTQAVGTHVLADLVDASRLDDPGHVETVLRECVTVAGASLLYIYVHHFDSAGGVSGVAVLAESHISFHSWPEHRFAAVDIFMCGTADPDRAIPVLRKGFSPKRIITHEFKRGRAAFVPVDRSLRITQAWRDGA